MASTHEDGFREIQLSGKQLVFYCMAALVFIVVVFLMGVQVGRGVLAQRGLPEAGEAGAFARETEPPPAPPAVTQGSTPPVTAGEKLSYAERLASPEPPAEQLKKTVDAPASASARSETGELRRDRAGLSAVASAKVEATPGPEGRPKPESPSPPTRSAVAAKGREGEPQPAATASTEPAGSGFEIQVGALRERALADSIAQRLVAKGYPAYVVPPAKGTPDPYRVRVGKYKDRREADTVAAKLQKEEQFKPWVVR